MTLLWGVIGDAMLDENRTDYNKIIHQYHEWSSIMNEIH